MQDCIVMLRSNAQSMFHSRLVVYHATTTHVCVKECLIRVSAKSAARCRHGPVLMLFMFQHSSIIYPKARNM